MIDQTIRVKTKSSRPRVAIAPSLLLVPTNSDYEVLCRRLIRQLPSKVSSKVRVVSSANFDKDLSRRTKEAITLVVSRLTDLDAESNAFVDRSGSSRQVVFLEEMPIEAIASRVLPLHIRNPRRLHIATRSSPADLLHRLVLGLTQSNGPEPIADAWVEGEFLVVLSPDFNRLSVPKEKLIKYVGEDATQFNTFEIDDDGRFLHWPHADAHFGWSQLLQLIDPTAGLEKQQRTKQFNERFGAAIRAIRERHGIKQSGIDGLTERHLRRIELGEQPATKASLAVLAAAHGVALTQYLDMLAKLMGAS